MIHINLLSTQKIKKTKKKMEFQSQLIGATAVIAVVISIMGYFAWSLFSQVDSLQAEAARLTTELTALQIKVKEVENFERDKKVVQEKIKVIEQLRKNQSIPVHLLDEISKSLPERVWLSSLNEQSGIIDLEGKATTNSDIVEFINNLKKSSLFRDVQILESRQNLEGTISIYSFKLKWAIVSKV